MISVIVPVYKVEKYLDRCVDSIVGQTYKNLEIILVDDGSPDSCPSMCDEWAKKDSRIKVIHKQNGGPSDARNAGMKVANGEYIGFVDSDDYISSDMYERLLDSIEKTDSDISCCGAKMVWEDGRERLLTPDGEHILDNLQAVKSIICEDVLKQVVWNRLYKTELVSDIMFPVGKYHEDVFWNYKAISRAKKVSALSAPCYFYTQREGSIMSAGYSEKRMDAVSAYEERSDFMAENYPSLLPLARSKQIGCYLHHYQLLTLSDYERKNELLKDLFERAKKADKEWQKCTYTPLKQKMWYRLFLIFPRATCKIRNMLKMGV